MKPRLLSIILILSVLIPCTATAQWSTANLSSGRYLLAAGATGNTAIVAGGIGQISIPPGVSDIYNSTTNTWAGINLFFGRTWLSGAGAGDKIAFAGGNNDWIFAIYDQIDI